MILELRFIICCVIDFRCKLMKFKNVQLKKYEFELEVLCFLTRKLIVWLMLHPGHESDIHQIASNWVQNYFKHISILSNAAQKAKPTPNTCICVNIRTFWFAPAVTDFPFLPQKNSSTLLNKQTTHDAAQTCLRFPSYQNQVHQNQPQTNQLFIVHLHMSTDNISHI